MPPGTHNEPLALYFKAPVVEQTDVGSLYRHSLMASEHGIRKCRHQRVELAVVTADLRLKEGRQEKGWPGSSTISIVPSSAYPLMTHPLLSRRGIISAARP